MIDGPKLAKYLNDTGLKVQEFWFLYCVMNLEDVFRGVVEVSIPQDKDNTLFNKHVFEYFKNHNPDIDGKTKWSTLAFQLEEKGWIETFQRPEEGKKLAIRKCRVTEQFKNTFLVSDSMEAFVEFVKTYPRFVHVNGKNFSTIDMSPELLAEIYNTKILKKGNLLLHERCLLITGMYLRDNNGEANYKMSSYFERYEGIALGYEGLGPTEKSSTGRRVR